MLQALQPLSVDHPRMLVYINKVAPMTGFSSVADNEFLSIDPLEGIAAHSIPDARK